MFEYLPLTAFIVNVSNRHMLPPKYPELQRRNAAQYFSWYTTPCVCKEVCDNSQWEKK